MCNACIAIIRSKWRSACVCVYVRGGGKTIGDYDFAMRHFRSTHRDYWKKSFVNRDRTELRLCEKVNFFLDSWIRTAKYLRDFVRVLRSASSSYLLNYKWINQLSD